MKMLAEHVQAACTWTCYTPFVRGIVTKRLYAEVLQSICTRSQYKPAQTAKCVPQAPAKSFFTKAARDGK